MLKLLHRPYNSTGLQFGRPIVAFCWFELSRKKHDWSLSFSASLRMWGIVIDLVNTDSVAKFSRSINIHYEFLVVVWVAHDLFRRDDFSDEIEHFFLCWRRRRYFYLFAETLPFHSFVWGSFEQLRLQSL